MMLAQLPTDVQTLQSAFPHYAPYFTVGFILLTAIGRGITAIRNDGGIKSIWNSIVMGSSTTTTATPKNSAPPPIGSIAATATKITLVAFLLGSGLICFTACSSNEITTAYKTETAIDASVTTAWSLWEAYVKATPTVSAATQAEVSAAFQKVQAAEIAAIDATALAASTTNGIASSAAYETALASMNQDFTDLQTLLATFNIKI